MFKYQPLVHLFETTHMTAAPTVFSSHIVFLTITRLNSDLIIDQTFTLLRISLSFTNSYDGGVCVVSQLWGKAEIKDNAIDA